MVMDKPSPPRPSAASPSSSHGGSSEGSFATSKKQRRKRPIIRVVRVFAPKRVETDAANFRSLVQKLTGNNGLNLETEIKTHIQQSDCFAASPTNNDINYLPGVDNYGEIRILESSRQTKKENKRRKPSCSDCLLETQDSHRKKLQSSPCCSLKNPSQHGDEDDEWAFNDSMESGVNLQNCLDLERTVEDVIDGFFACGDDDTGYSNKSFASCLRSSNSSSNTFVESPSSPFQNKVDAIDEKLNVFHHFNAPHHLSMQLDTYQLLLNCSW